MDPWNTWVGHKEVWEMAQEELEKWSPKSIECYRDGLSVEQELSKGGGLQKVTYMLNY